LYELLTGRLPFAADTVGRLFDLVLHSDPPPPRLYNPEIPQPLEEVCLKALAKNPAERYQTADDLAAQLNALAAVLEIQQPSGQAIRRQSMITPLRAALISVATAALVLLAVIIYFATQRGTGPDIVGEKPPQVAKLDRANQQEIQELVAQLRQLTRQQEEELLPRLSERSVQPKIGERGGIDAAIPVPAPPDHLPDELDPPPPLPIRAFAGTTDVPVELKRLEADIEEAREAGDNDREFALLQNASNEWLHLGDADRADKSAQRMLEVANGNVVNLCFAHSQLGLTRSNLGRYDDALVHNQRALALFRPLYEASVTTSQGDPKQSSRMARLVGLTLSRIGNVEKRRNNFDEAEAAYIEARDVLQPYADRRDELAGVLMNLGTLQSRQERYHDAIDTLGQAMSIAESLDDDSSRCDILVNLAGVQARAGDNSAALESYAAAAELLTPDSAYDVRSLLLVNWTLTLLEEGQLEKAGETYTQLRETAREDDDYAQRVVTLLQPVLEPTRE
jgi:tetratricopeptide (TPR) repeat protein